MTELCAAPPASGGAAPLLDSIAPAEGLDRMADCMARLMTLVAPERMHRSGHTGFHLMPESFAHLNDCRHQELSEIEALAAQLHGAPAAPRLEPLIEPRRWPNFQELDGRLCPTASTLVPAELAEALPRAMHAVDLADPELGSWLRRLVQLVVTFHGEQPLSFATLQAHGAIFLNWRAGDGFPFLIEELTHQGGHVLLSTAMFATEARFFDVDPGTPVEFLGVGADDEHRTLLVLFHAVFTEALMVIGLRGAVESAESTVERAEIEGRLQFIARRFAEDLLDLVTTDALAALGRETLRHCAEIFDSMARPALERNRFDLSGQPYAFCRATFFARNSDSQRDGP